MSNHETDTQTNNVTNTTDSNLVTENTSLSPYLAATRRRHLINTLIVIGLVGLMMAILYKGLNLDATKVPSAQIDREAHDFTVKTVSGANQWPAGMGIDQQFSLRNFLGKPVILNFWASWCYSCRAEAHNLEQFWELHKKDDIAVIGIAIQDTTENAQAFAQQYGKTYLLGLDVTGKASLDYGVSGVPETFFIDRLGVIKHKEVGPVTVASIEKYLPNITAK